MESKYFIQYHNSDNLGRYPTTGIDFSSNVDSIILDNSIRFDSWIYTRKKLVEKAVGKFCFLIAGKALGGKKYFLWSCFKIKGVELGADGFYRVYGTGHDFEKPILLNGLDQFDDFKSFCGNFGLGFQNIDKHPFCDVLSYYTSHLDFNSPTQLHTARVETFESILEQINNKMKGIEPERVTAEITTILRRDRIIVDLIKKLTNYKCQFPDCSSKVLTKAGKEYVEVAHVKPVHLGGQSVIGNLIVLCPNHHKEFDYGNLRIEEQTNYFLKGSLNGKPFSINFHK